jgi:hypothetical protein
MLLRSSRLRRLHAVASSSSGAVLLLGAVLLADGARASTVDVPYTTSAIALSGALSQFPTDGKLFSLSGQSSDNTATFYAAWDSSYLYFGVQVADTSLQCAAMPRDSSTAYAYDSVELNFDLKTKKTISQGDTDFRQWIFPICYSSTNDDVYDAYGTGAYGDTTFNGTATATYALKGTLNDSTADTGYTVIIRIPWGDLSLTPKNGLSFGFDGAVNDLDSFTGDTTFEDWANLTTFAQPDKWNALRLAGRSATVDGSPAILNDAGVGLEHPSSCTTCGNPEGTGCSCSLAGGGGERSTLLGVALLAICLAGAAAAAGRGRRGIRGR